MFDTSECLNKKEREMDIHQIEWRSVLLLTLLSLYSFILYPQAELSLKDRDNINSIEENIINDHKVEIVTSITYPLYRPYPLNPIYNAEQFMSYYDTIFDSELVSRFRKSSIQTNWSKVGWRGLMFNNGDIWLSYEGSIISINYSSTYEESLRQEKVDDLRHQLNPEIQGFTNPVAILETQHFFILVDYIDSKYRYISWNKPKRFIDSPNIIISNGTITHDGQLGVFYMMFKNGSYTYTLKGSGQLFQVEDLYVERAGKRLTHEKCITKWDLDNKH